MSYYPSVSDETVKNLLVIRRLAAEQADYFDGSPYGKDIEDLVKGSTPKARVETEQKDDSDLDIMKEIQDTYKELQDHKPDNSDAAAVMSYYRTRTSLLEKLLEQMERGKNQKYISDFYTFVMEVLEEVTSPTQREVFKDRLKEFAQ